MEGTVSPRPPADRAPRDAGVELSGWTIFAGVALLVVGSLDALWGLAAVLNNEVVIVGGQGVLVADITAWGWVHLILGSIVALTGLGLFARMDAARIAAIFFISVNAVAQIVWFPAAPLWALLIIMLDVAIVYQLSVNWER